MTKKIVLTAFIFSFVCVCFYAYSEYGSSEQMIKKRTISLTTKEQITLNALKIETITIEKRAAKSIHRQKITSSVSTQSETMIKNCVIDAIFENTFSVASYQSKLR